MQNKKTISLLLISLVVFSIRSPQLISGMDNVKVDENITLKWLKTFDLNGIFKLHPYVSVKYLTKLNDGGYAFYAESFYIRSFIKTDSLGNIVFLKEFSKIELNFSINTLDWFVNILGTKDGGILLSGEDVDRSLFLIKYSLNGTLLWNKIYYYNNSNAFAVINPIELPDENLIITFSTAKSTEDKFIKTVILKLDKNGEKIWEKIIPHEFDEAYTIYAYSRILQNNTIGLIHMKANYPSIDVIGLRRLDFDLEGKFNQELTFNFENPIINGNNLRFLLLEDGSCYFSFQNDNNIFLYKFNSNLSIEYYKIIPNFLYQTSFMIDKKDGGIILYGKNQDNDMYIENLDSTGNLLWNISLGTLNEDENIIDLVINYESDDDLSLIFLGTSVSNIPNTEPLILLGEVNNQPEDLIDNTYQISDTNSTSKISNSYPISSTASGQIIPLLIFFILYCKKKKRI